jgi:hypothetical protein
MDLISPCVAESSLSAAQPKSSSSSQAVQKKMSGAWSLLALKAKTLSGGDSSYMFRTAAPSEPYPTSTYPTTKGLAIPRNPRPPTLCATAESLEWANTSPTSAKGHFDVQMGAQRVEAEHSLAEFHAAGK